MGDRLKVQTEFANAFLSLSIEQCWVSDNPSADKRSVAQDQWLIYEACPTSTNVTMFPTQPGSNPAFAFEVTEEHRRMGQIYLFCIMGLCSPMKQLTTGNLGLVRLNQFIFVVDFQLFSLKDRYTLKKNAFIVYL